MRWSSLVLALGAVMFFGSMCEESRSATTAAATVTNRADGITVGESQHR